MRREQSVTFTLQVASRVRDRRAGVRRAWKKLEEVCMRREKGRQALKVALLRKDWKKGRHCVEVKLLPRVVSKGVGRAVVGDSEVSEMMVSPVYSFFEVEVVDSLPATRMGSWVVEESARLMRLVRAGGGERSKIISSGAVYGSRNTNDSGVRLLGITEAEAIGKEARIRSSMLIRDRCRSLVVAVYLLPFRRDDIGRVRP